MGQRPFAFFLTLFNLILLVVHDDDNVSFISLPIVNWVFVKFVGHPPLVIQNFCGELSLCVISSGVGCRFLCFLLLLPVFSPDYFFCLLSVLADTVFLIWLRSLHQITMIVRHTKLNSNGSCSHLPVDRGNHILFIPNIATGLPKDAKLVEENFQPTTKNSFKATNLWSKTANRFPTNELEGLKIPIIINWKSKTRKTGKNDWSS